MCSRSIVASTIACPADQLVWLSLEVTAPPPAAPVRPAPYAPPHRGCINRLSPQRDNTVHPAPGLPGPPTSDLTLVDSGPAQDKSYTYFYPDCWLSILFMPNSCLAGLECQLGLPARSARIAAVTLTSETDRVRGLTSVQLLHPPHQHGARCSRPQGHDRRL